MSYVKTGWIRNKNRPSFVWKRVARSRVLSEDQSTRKMGFVFDTIFFIIIQSIYFLHVDYVICSPICVDVEQFFLVFGVLWKFSKSSCEIFARIDTSIVDLTCEDSFFKINLNSTNSHEKRYFIATMEQKKMFAKKVWAFESVMMQLMLVKILELLSVKHVTQRRISTSILL